MQSFYVYILKCNDGSYYTGQTDDLETRLEQHVLGEINSYTASRKPLQLVYSETFPSRCNAKEAEWKIKKWSRAKKKAFIDRDFDLLKKKAYKNLMI